MLFLEQIRLVKYCGYEDSTFSFLKPDDTPYQFIGFYAPNGCGKSMLLNAIMLLSMNTSGRAPRMIEEYLRKYVRNPDYEPGYESLKGRSYKEGYITGKNDCKLPDMLIEGVYIMDGKQFTVQLNQNGFIRNDFAPLPPEDADPEDSYEYLNAGPFGKRHLQYRQRITHTLASDTDLAISKFQLQYSQMDKFEKIVSEITRFKADCVAPSGTTGQDRGYCTDFVITKACKKTGVDHKIHFKQMSSGERHIIKSFSELLNLMSDLENPARGEIGMPGWPRLILIDEVEQHIYWDRHITLIECLKRVFNQQQLFVTSHSGVLIPRVIRKENDTENELWIDLENV